LLLSSFVVGKARSCQLASCLFGGEKKCAQKEASQAAKVEANPKGTNHFFFLSFSLSLSSLCGRGLKHNNCSNWNPKTLGQLAPPQRGLSLPLICVASASAYTLASASSSASARLATLVSLI